MPLNEQPLLQVICFAAYQTRRVGVAANQLKRVREWLTPKRRLWIGAALMGIWGGLVSVKPGPYLLFLQIPAVILFMGAWPSWRDGKR